MWPEDLPKNAVEFDRRFGTEESCREYLFSLKWPQGFKCPRCGNDKGWSIEKRYLLECSICAHQASLTAGTVMEKTRKPLVLWFKAMYLMVSNKTGVSARNLQVQLGLGSYQTAWAWLQKLRIAMGGRSMDSLKGQVEVDESYVGGYEEGVVGREKGQKSIVAGAVEDECHGMGRVRLRVVPDASAASLAGFVRENVKEGVRVRTDGWASYCGLGESGYEHERLVAGPGKKASKTLPLVHIVFSLAKRVLLGTYHGFASEKHLQRYLDEFVFRFNRRKVKYPTRKFHRLAELAASSKAMPYWKIVGRKEAHRALHLVAA